MKIIADVRLFESDVPNVDGNSMPSYIGKIYQYDDTECFGTVQRLLFLLRHRGFVFDGFDHLYVNFTPCVSHAQVQDVNRYTIREFSWYHYVDVGCDTEIFNNLSSKEKNSFIIESIKAAILLKSPSELQQLFEDTFDEVVEKNEFLLIPYKLKENPNYSVEIFIRIDNEASFIPLIRISDTNGVIKAEQELRHYGRDEFICQTGTISIGKSSVKIIPRKNQYADHYELTPIKIEW